MKNISLFVLSLTIVGLCLFWRSSCVSPPVKLGISFQDAEMNLGVKLTAVPVLIDYWDGKPTDEQLKEDVVKYAELNLSSVTTLLLGFNAADVLVEVQQVRTWR